MPPIAARHRDLLMHTRLHDKSGKSPVSAVARVERRGRQLHGARWETTLRGVIGDAPIIERVFHDFGDCFSRIAVGQSMAGLHGVCCGGIRVSAPHTPFCTPCCTPDRSVMHTRLERVHAPASTRCRRGETVKPVFIKDRVAVSKELIAAAHTALPHVA